MHLQRFSTGNIFDDLDDVVAKLPGRSSEDIADGLEQWISMSSKEVQNNFDLESRALRWRIQHGFSLLGRRLQGLIRGIELDEKL